MASFNFAVYNGVNIFYSYFNSCSYVCQKQINYVPDGDAYVIASLYYICRRVSRYRAAYGRSHVIRSNVAYSPRLISFLFSKNCQKIIYLIPISLYISAVFRLFNL